MSCVGVLNEVALMFLCKAVKTKQLLDLNRFVCNQVPPGVAHVNVLFAGARLIAMHGRFQRTMQDQSNQNDCMGDPKLTENALLRLRTIQYK